MPSRFKDRIIQHLAHTGYEPSVAGVIARDMRVLDDDRADFDAAIEQLHESGRILVGERNGLIRLPPLPDEVVGRLRVNARGFGFVIPANAHAEGDVFIPASSIGDAITGDTVRAAVHRRPGERGPRSTYGSIVEIIERGQTSFVGVLTREGKQWLVIPDGRKLNDPVVVRDPHARNAKVGDKVVIEILHYPEGDYLGEGVIIDVLGEAGRPDVETQAVITAHGLRDDFSSAVTREAGAAARGFDQDAPPSGYEDREDLTDRFTFTIDPPDARDFDDAITIEFDPDARQWTLGVHIADVSHFVQPGGALDQEATQRGNSVYLPRLVLPMLPELLSNGVCSLQEGVPRLTKSTFMTYDEKGNVTSQRLASTIIRSNKRLTYLEAQALIDGDTKEAAKHTRSEPEYADVLIEKLAQADRLARTLRKRRQRDGMISLELPDVELVYDDDGHVVDAVPEDDAFTHTIIEMFMVEANEAVARTFNALLVPLLRRVHPEPVHGDLAELEMYARAARFRLPESPTRHDLQRLLDATRGTPAARAVHFAVLKTLTKAEYSPAMIGHFALASDHYAHFTSPIRRYPDLLVHRVVRAYCELTNNGSNAPRSDAQRTKLGRRLRDHDQVLDEGELIEMGRHCSETERNAEEAERELREFLVLQFLAEHHLGDEFQGAVTGVNPRAVFISIDRFLAEGMVNVRDLPQPSGKADRWTIDPGTGRLATSRSGMTIGVGDAVTVQIVAVDTASRHLDLLITRMPARTSATRRREPEGTTKRRAKNSKSTKSRKGRPPARRGRR